MALPRRLHFIGAGGAGMAPLASLCALSGRVITASDREENGKTRALQKLGAVFHAGHAADNLPDDCELVIYSSAVPADNPEMVKARKLGIKCINRGSALAEFSLDYKRVVAVSGAHGKSSITAMISYILTVCNRAPGYMIGADFNGFDSYSSGNGDIFVTEADESDGTHTLLHPWCGVVPNYDPDHAWSVGGEDKLKENFRTFGSHCRNIISYDFPESSEFFAGHPSAEYLKSVSDDFTFAGFFGYEAANARIAVKCCELLGCGKDEAVEAVKSFPGIARRMTRRVVTPELIVIEDYAHHPTEVRNSINLLRHNYPEHHLRVLFQPHRYARLEKFFEGFVTELSKADSLLIAPVFAAWSETGSVNSETLAARCGALAVTGSWEEIALKALELPCGDACPLLLAVLGAGDINRVFPYLERATVR